jgi:hypothetical protein
MLLSNAESRFTDLFGPAILSSSENIRRKTYIGRKRGKSNGGYKGKGEGKMK